MRALTGILGCLTLSVCYAVDEPPTPAVPNTGHEPALSAPTPSAQASSTQPTDAAPADAASAHSNAAQTSGGQQPTAEVDDRILRAKGYKVKLVNGERYYCRRDEVLGTRLQSALQCTTAEELRRRQERSRETLEQTQRNFSKMPDGGKP